MRPSTSASFPFLTALGLLALVVITRLPGHLGTPLTLPDASWAVFFLGGFYLTRQWRWALSLFAAACVGVDVLALVPSGSERLCATPAYGFILPAYTVLWLGGRWLRGSCRGEWRDLARLALCLTGSVSACYLITNGSYYWLGSHVAHPTLSGWGESLAHWYAPFLLIACAYVGLAALIEIARTGYARAHPPVATT